MGAPQVGALATHPGSAHPPSHHPVLYPRAARTFPIFALPTVQGRRDRGRECARSRGRGQPRRVLYQRSVLSPRAEALGRTACTCTRTAPNHMPGIALISRTLITLQISATPIDPNTRPPSYSLLGVLILFRIGYRLLNYLRDRSPQCAPSIGDEKKSPSPSNSDEPHIDDRPVSTLLNYDPETDLASGDEKEKLTVLDLETVPASVRAGRTCTLCLEERTATCVTECGHIFDWNCIYSWGRERVRPCLL